MPQVKNQKSVEFQPPSKKTIGILITLVILFFLATSLRSFATFYTDALFFSSLEQGSTFRKLLNARLFVPTIAFAAMTLLVAITIFVATRFGKKNSFSLNFDEWILPFARAFRAKTNLIRNVVALFVGFVFAGTTVGFEKQWLLYTNSQTVGEKDPLFKKDIGFYLFELPFIRLALGWIFSALVILLIVAFVAHYVNGSIRFERAKRHISVPAKVHLSIICALAGLVKAVQYYFDRFALVTSTRGARDGAAYTDVNAALPATRLLIFVAIIASILFIVNVYRKGVVLPLVAIGLWLIVSLVVGGIYPLIVQNYVVNPSRNSKEEPFAKRNITATRQAYGLTEVENTPVEFEQGLTSETADEAKKVLSNSILWNEESLEPWMQQKRGEQIYEFRNIDRDRYEIDGKVSPVFVSARELVSADQLPDRSWPSLHATFSHGYGAAIARATQVQDENEPSYFVSDLPNKDQQQDVSDKDLELDTSKARVYFGEGLQDFVFVGSSKSEQTPTDDSIKLNDLGGVKVDNFVKRAAFSLRYSDVNILITDTVTPSSKIVFIRDPRERIQKIAPFLDVDSNPYPVVTNGEVVWVVDAYTSSDQYPYSQFIDNDNLSIDSSLRSNINYARNSVKATVNARTGEVNLYIVDKKDPIVKAYKNAFPDLFKDVSKAPEDIVSHFRYPEDLFEIQTEIYSEYHVNDAVDLLKGSRRWQVAPISLDTPVPTAGTATLTNPVQGGRADAARTTGVPLAPLYQYVQHTAMESPEFVLTRSFVPIRSSFKMDSFISASSDGENYGKLRLVSFNSKDEVSALSPTQALGQINSDKEFSQETTLLDQRGSSVISGPLQIVPVADTVVYVQPIYVRGESRDSRPVLTYVTVSVNGRTVCAPTIDQAVDALVSGASFCVPFTQNIVDTSTPETPAVDQPDNQGDNPQTDQNDITKLTQAQLIERLSKASADYEKAKNPLDLGALQKAADEMVKLVDELNRRGG